MNTWIISDTHFGHSNIIKYCNRPFKDAGHMDRVMIERWQSRVDPKDLVYHLGDVGLTRGDYLDKIIEQLPGKKILILGNHDKSAKRMMEMGFEFACSSMTIECEGKILYLNHRPLQYNPGVDYVLHGHIHNSLPEHRKIHVQKGELVDIPYFNINLSVEVINYEPISLPAMIRGRRRFCSELPNRVTPL